MNIPNSPIFAPLQLSNHHGDSIISTLNGANDSPTTSTSQIFLPNLPDKPTVSTSSFAAYIVTSEQNLFVQGFEPHEYMSRPPTLLRGSLVIKVFKPTKIKTIGLTFKGIQRTDWPEGIPPKKNQYNEINEIVTHTWPFFQGNLNEKVHNHGADCFIEKNGTQHHSTPNEDDIVSVRSGTPPPSGNNNSNSHLSTSHSQTRRSHRDESPSAANFFSRTLSPSFMRRAKSPSIASMTEATKNGSILDLPSNPSNLSSDSHANIQFAPGDYIYNFEHPLPASIPESCDVTFGSTSYYLEVNITRPGTFKSNISGRLNLNIVRTLSESSLEENESIVITRDWEDQLHYDIVIGAKSVVLDLYLPLAFRFVPLFGKVALHRIRIYLTENLEYYCSNKKVHRLEPPKKYLLLEHKAEKGRSLLSSKNPDGTEANLNDFDEDILPKELEFQLFVPTELNMRTNSKLHPDTSYDNIQAHHWIKICLRISRLDPNNPEKRKHYEISIDSPLHVLNSMCSHGNTLLPAYDDLIPRTGSSRSLLARHSGDNTPLSPGVTPVEHSNHSRSASIGNGIFGRFNSPSGGSGSNSNNNSSRSRSGSYTPGDNEVDRPLTPIEFHHISAGLEDAGVVEREADMHLEANLYQPKDEANVTAINSPQAMPHPGTFTSPLMLPVQRPIHLLRQPSTMPPPFEADVAPPPLEPPSYEETESRNERLTSRHQLSTEQSRSLSLSPLRIDEPAESASVSATSNADFLNGGFGSNTPVRDLLSQQLSGKRNSIGSAPRGLVEPTSTIDENIPPIAEEVPVPQIEISNPDGESTNSSGNDETSTNTVDNAETSEQTANLSDAQEEDIVDYPSSPILPPSTLAGMAKLSRSSSVTSTGSIDFPVEQTLPLLGSVPSQNSLLNSAGGGANNYRTRNESTGSLLYEFAKPTEFVDELDPGPEIYKMMSSSLSKLRNPRLHKHYQDQELNK
ncbi:Arrestin-related trafficking adapter 3 [Candida viswanathii]|uniref:Arrestin-related trafficking adapter 3 n=1 Tax=Candida viswanathii TaxID=5486 RepID=A0A367YG62_9ASCO|nr:Arrestin-related trafficking adapter 3 [Candida viswanathii]